MSISCASKASSCARRAATGGSSSSSARSIAATSSASTSPIRLVAAAVVGERCLGRQRRVAERRGDARGLQQGRAVLGLAELALGLAQAHERLAALAVLLGARQIKRVAVQLRRVRRERAARARAFRPARVSGGLGGVDRGGRETPMKRQLRQGRVRALARELLERKADPVVQPGAPRRAEPLVEGLVDERMGEAEFAHAARRTRPAVRRRQPARHGRARALPRSGAAREQSHVERAADHRRELERVGGLRAEPRHAALDDLAHALREPERRASLDPPSPCLFVVCEGSRFGQAADDLADEERVAGGLAAMSSASASPSASRSCPASARRMCATSSGTSPCRARRCASWRRPQVGEHLCERMLLAEVGVAVGDHHLPVPPSRSRERDA